MSTGILTGYRSIWQFSLAAVASLIIYTDSIILAGSDSALTAGDRNPSLLCRYPKDVYLHTGKGGHFLDVTKPPFNAKGDGKANDTTALIAAYDYCLAKMDQAGWTGGGPKAAYDYVVYLPNGTYRVTDTIVYSGPARTGRRPNRWEQVAQIRFVGESREKTRIQLANHCAGFDQPSKCKAVLSFGKTTFNNHKAMTAVRNLTIDTGRGNSGAVALDFMGANIAEIRNVHLRSGDKQGVAGLLIKTAPTIGHHRDILIEGFDCGILLDFQSRASHPVFEFVTLRGQRQVGIRLQNGSSASFRKIFYEGAAPALEVTTPRAQAVLLDSVLRARGGAKAAIVVRSGELFARDVQTEGYRAPIVKPEAVVFKKPDVDEFVAGKVVSRSGGRSLRLRVAEHPELSWEPLEEWVSPEDCGAKADGKTDDTSAIQAALDAGKRVVYFPGRTYRADGRLRVPPGVRRINGMFHSLGMHFVVDQAASFPVVFEDFLHAGIRMQSGRPVAVQFADWARYQNACPDGSAQLFLSGVHGPGRKTNPDASGRLTLWGRSVNSEGRSLPFGISNMDCWIMGFKTERADLIWDVQGGSNLEVLGGTMGVAHPKDYFLIRDTSRLSAVANTSGFGLRGRERILRNEKPNALQRNLTTSDFPVRNDRPRQIFIPLLRID